MGILIGICGHKLKAMATFGGSRIGRFSVLGQKVADYPVLCRVVGREQKIAEGCCFLHGSPFPGGCKL